MEKVRKPEVILGIDPGASSIGWAVHETGNQENFETGVVKFPAANDIQEKQTKAAQRRDSRSARRGYFRTKMRNDMIVDHFLDNSLVSLKDLFSEGDRGNGFSADFLSLNPYEIRNRALSQEISAAEFLRMCYHMSNGRGYKSSGKELSEEEGKIVTGFEDRIGIKQTNDEIASNGFETIGQYLYHMSITGGQVRRRYFLRSLLVDETAKVVERQRSFNSRNFFSDSAFIEKLIHKKNGILFFQRPLKSCKHLIGKCQFEQNKPRMMKSHPLFERFRALQFINTITLTTEDGAVCRPDAEQRMELLGLFESKETLSINSIKTQLGFSKSEMSELEFNYDSDCNDDGKIPGSKCSIALSRIFGKEAWDSKTMQQKTEIWNMYNFKDIDEIVDYAKNVWEAGDEGLAAARKVSVGSDYSNLSHKAVSKLMPFLEQGMLYHEAVFMMGVADCFGSRWESIGEGGRKDVHSEYRSITMMSEQAFNMKAFKGYLNGVWGLEEKDLGKLQHHSFSEKELLEFLPEPPKSANPQVNRALSLSRKLVNELIERYDIAEIVVELPREFGKSHKQLRDIEKENNANRVRNRKISEELTEKGYSEWANKKKGILKYKLWQETNGFCIYTGNEIPLEHLFNGEIITIEHIFPKSVMPNNSTFNLTLCYRDENHEKSNMTPYQYYSGNKKKWSQMKEMAKKYFSKAKYKHFISEENPSFEDFVSINMNDTRYIAREVKSYFENICRKVRTTNGRMTSRIRNAWSLNEVLGGDPKSGKNRSDNRNHAIDALVASHTTPKMIEAVCTAMKLGKDDMENIAQFIPAPYSLGDFISDVRREMERIVVVHVSKSKKYTTRKLRFVKNGVKHTQKTKSFRGQLHEETIYGKSNEEGIYRKTKSLKSITLPSVEQIIDPQVKHSVKEFMKLNANAAAKDDKGLKALKQGTVYLLDKKGRKTQVIKSVKVYEPSSTMVRLKDDERKYVAPGNNVCFAARKSAETQKWEMKAVSFFEYVKNMHGNPESQGFFRNDENNFVVGIDSMVVMGLPFGTDPASLSREHLSALTHRVRKTSGTSINFAHHADGRPVAASGKSKDELIGDIRITSTKKFEQEGIRKVEFDITGRLISVSGTRISSEKNLQETDNQLNDK